MSETSRNVYECLSEITDQTTVVNICSKDKTILFYDKFKDILFDLVSEYLMNTVIDLHQYYDPNEDKFIVFMIIDR